MPIRTIMPALIGVILALSLTAAEHAASASPAKDTGATHRAPSDPHPTNSAQPDSYPALLARARSGESVGIIVSLNLAGTPFQAEGRLSAADTRQQRNRIAQAGNQVVAELAGTEYRLAYQYETIPALALRVDDKALQVLRKSSQVGPIVEDLPVWPALADSTALIGASSAWSQGHDGSGWAVAILDTGIDGSHPFFRDSANNSRIVAEACFSNSGGLAPHISLCPDGSASQTGPGAADATIAACNGGSLCSHGTHVAGISAGYSSGSRKGVAPNADIIAIQVFSRIESFTECPPGESVCTGSFPSDQIAAMDYINNTLSAQHDVAALNMSLGGGGSSSYCDSQNAATKAAIDNLRSKGIATAIATGNAGRTGEIGSPACISTSIAVGSTTKSDAVSGFSDVASIMDLFAPGANIVSSIPGGGYGSASGTSMAAPHVAGAWAVMRQAYPTASVDDVLHAFEQTGPAITDQRPGGSVTKPRIQLDAALDYLDNSTMYTVTASVGSGSGTISPSGPQQVPENGTTTFTLSPDPGQEIDSVGGTCGGTLSGNSYETDPVTADCTVVASFRPFSGEPVVCGTLDHDIIQSMDGSSFDFVSGQARPYDGNRRDDINIYEYTPRMYVYWYADQTSFAVGGVVDASNNFKILQPGDTVGPSASFSDNSMPMHNWLAGANGYLGIAFENRDTGQLNYGWLQMTTTAPGGHPATWGDYCYDQTGNSIQIPVPEIDVIPTSLSATLEEGQTHSQPLNVGNSGGMALNWQVATDPGSCASGAGVSWLSVAPTSGTTSPQSSDVLVVDVDASGLSEGSHAALICISSDDPINDLVSVPFTLEVVAAPSGTVAGTVESLGYCSDAPAVLEGAQVAISGVSGSYSAITDASGAYSVDIDVDDSPVDVSVSHPDHFGDSQSGVTISDGQTTAVSFQLELDAACARPSPGALSQTLVEGTSSSVVLELGNDGAASLEWSADIDASDCDALNDAVSWLDLDPLQGIISANDQAQIEVTADATGLAAGSYGARICINTDDADNPRIAVPYSLEVLDDLLFEDRFEQ